MSRSASNTTEIAPPAAAAFLPATAPWPERVTAALLAAGCLAVLLVAASLTPSPTGHGTHEQLGLPACGWLLATGRPCPTCGMTTAFAAGVAGDWLGSLRAHPFGTVLVLGMAAGFWGSLHVAVFGSRMGRVCARLMRPRWVWGAAGLWAGAWAYKMATWGNG